MKSKLFVLLCLATVGFVACQTATVLPSIGLTCANPLNGAAFGFTLSVPADFTCINVEPNADLDAFVRYRQGAGGSIISITVPKSGTLPTGCAGDPNCTDLTGTTNGAGLVFSRVKISAAAGGITVTSYVAVTTLPNGKVLGITIAGFSDVPALLATLDSVIASVTLTP